jgi:hypothetical protein
MSSLQMALAGMNKTVSPKAAAKQAAPRTREYLDPKECGGKTKNVFKEFFVGGDIDDAVLSLHELVGIGSEGHVERGAAVVEAAVLTVMEMKESDVDKMIQVFGRCLAEHKISYDSIAMGLSDPLEFLRDVEIDAPLAPKLLATIMADWMQRKALSLERLQTAPAYFLSDGRPAEFAVLLLSKRGEPYSENELDVVANLMTDEERQIHPSVLEWILSTQ